jgi:hypothetical protein
LKKYSTGLLILCLALFGCGQKRQAADDIYFDVVDSLLEAPTYLGDTGRVLRPPKGFMALPDSLVGRLRGIMADSLGSGSRVSLMAYFWEDSTGGSLIVSRIAGLTLGGDTAAFMGEYRASLENRYGAAGVKAGDFVHNGIYFKNLIVGDSAVVTIRLIGLSDKQDAVELMFSLPSGYYPDLIKPVESSIGSLK